MIIDLQKLILILVRITAFIVICPGFSFRGLPNIMKIALSVSLTAIVYMVTPEMEAAEELLYFLILTVKETLFGLALGFVTKLIFAVMEIAGQLIDFQVGFSMASVFEPSMGTAVSNYGKVYYWLSICIFFLLDMHQRLIAALIQSFSYVPPATIDFGGISIKSIVILFGRVFELAINLAAPMIIVVLVTDIILGVISKTVPQINVLMLGMPLKALVSFIVFILIISWLMNSAGNELNMMPQYLNGFIKLF